MPKCNFHKVTLLSPECFSVKHLKHHVKHHAPFYKNIYGGLLLYHINSFMTEAVII